MLELMRLAVVFQVGYNRRKKGEIHVVEVLNMQRAHEEGW